MKYLITTIAALVLVGCGESQQSTSPEAKPIERVEGAKARVITIHNAVMLKQIAAVKQHIAAGTDVNAKLRGGHTPLHIAVEHTNPSYLEDMMAMDEDADGIVGVDVPHHLVEDLALLARHQAQTLPHQSRSLQ